MEAFSFSCPACGATLKTNTTVAGKNVRCPKCQQTFTAPAAPAAPAAPGASTAVQTVPAFAAPKGVTAPAGRSASWSPGQRVFARWNDGFSYPATVEACDTQSVRITFDDGTPGFVEP